jgi:protein translocase subunit secB
MDDQDNGATTAEKDQTGAAATPLPNGADTTPAAGMISQYIKDLSFENPNAPAVFQMTSPPQIDVQFNIGATQVGEDVHEVVLKLDVRAQVDNTIAFVVDFSYGGLFGLRNVPAEHVQPFLLGEAPRIMFPSRAESSPMRFATAASRRCCLSRSISTRFICNRPLRPRRRARTPVSAASGRPDPQRRGTGAP